MTPESNDPWTKQEIFEDGSSTRTVFDNGTEPWSSETSTFDAYQRLQSQRVVLDGGGQQVKEYDPNNTHPYDELDVDEDATGKPTGVQVKFGGQSNNADFSAVGQVLGSALGRALAPNNQFAQIAVGTVAGAIGQKLAQAFSASLLTDAAASANFSDAFAHFDITIAGAGAGSVASFLVAELGHALGLSGFQEQLFNASIGSLASAAANKIATDMLTNHVSFEAAIAGLNFGAAATTAAYSISSLLGSYLGHELVPAQTHEGAVGGQLLGAVGSAIGISAALSGVLGTVLNFIVPGLGSLVGTVLGTLIGDHFGNTPHPAAIDLVDQAGYFYGSSHYQVSEGGSYNSPDQMAAATDAIINAYLSAVKGAALDHSKQTWVGYVTDPNFRYINGEVPTHKYLSFISPDDAVHAAALDVLQHLEVIGGDLLLKRAHHNSPSNIPDPGPEWNGLTASSSQSGAEKLVTLGGDLSVAQDYENYLNNREAINALIAANPDTAFSAGWIATFARVNDLGLNHLNASDFLGGLVGYLDSVNKSGLGFAAADVSVRPGPASNVLVEARVGNWVEVPGSLSAFADATSVSSDSAGQTVQLAFNNSSLLALGFHFVASTTQSGDGSNDIWFSNPGAVNNFAGTGGNDILVGAAAADTIHGGAGWDFIDGGAGADTLYGDDGSDILRGGTGNDTLYGGTGDDTYVFNRGDGVDRLIDTVITTTTTSGWHDWYEDQNGTNIFHHDWVTTTATTHTDGGTDTLVFGPGIRAVDITTSWDGTSLIVTVHDPLNPNAQDIVILQNWADPKDRVEFFKFADGSIINVAGTGPNTFVLETAGSAKLTQVGNNYFFNSAGTGPALNYNGTAIVPGQVGAFAPIGAEPIAGGYEVAWQNAGANQVLVWSTDSNGSYNGTILGVVPGSSLALKRLESSFHQDLNGDGRIGVATTVIETAGAIHFTRLDDNFFLFDSNGSGPTLKWNGADLNAAQLTDGFVPVGAEQIAGGYQVAWRNFSTGLFSIWNTDPSGNYLSYTVMDVNSLALKSLESSFQQDLNGDGRINVVTVADTAGATRLTRIDDNFYLYDGNGNGPVLKYNGVVYEAAWGGAFAGFAAERVADGYVVAFKNPGTNQFSTWHTDVNGNGTSYTLMGNSLALESLEPSFQQDLNGDGTIGVVSMVLDTAGATRFTQIGNNFYLNDSSGNGPVLKYNGVVHDAAEDGAFAGFAAEQVADGYVVAFKNFGTNQFSTWHTDASGNGTSYTLLDGNSLALKSLETGFHQDLNGDGTLVLDTAGATRFTRIGDHFYLNDGSGNGPVLKYNGMVHDAAGDGAFAGFAAEQVADGYVVAFKNFGTNQFSTWHTDASGNATSYTLLDGNSLALESLEPSFQQDLNGDGTLVLDTAGATRFTRIGDHFYLNDGSGNGPVLTYNGVVHDAAEDGAFAGFAAEQVADGYVVAFKNFGTNQFSTWHTDASGNGTSYTLLDGNSGTLQSLEPSFQQDLNGDGMIGTASVLIGDGNANQLIGSAGNDTFVFNAALNATNVDTITDFDVAHDTIRLDKSVFTALAQSGVLDAGAFFAGSAAHDADDRIIYNASSGALSYDADGNGGGAAIQFAILAANLSLTNAHFTVV